MQTEIRVETSVAGRLQYFPVSFFAVVMGLCGLAIALKTSALLWGPDTLISPVALGNAFGMLAASVFIFLTAAYAAKFMLHRKAVLAELSHPVKMSFGATFSVSLILLSILFEAMTPLLSLWMFITGAAVQIAYTLYVINSWIVRTHYDIQHINPAWFIPVVGNILVPIAGVPHGFAEISWFFFSVGLLFWIILFTIIIYRMVFHHPLPDRLLPTLFILIAPPAVGFIAYFTLNGELDTFARVLYYNALFMTALLMLQIPRLFQLPFYLSWWAYTFPLAAMSIASMMMYEATGIKLFSNTGAALLGFLFIVVFYLMARTLHAISTRQICTEEH